MRSKKAVKEKIHDTIYIYVYVHGRIHCTFVMRTNAIMAWQMNYCFIHPFDAVAFLVFLIYYKIASFVSEFFFLITLNA